MNKIDLLIRKYTIATGIIMFCIGIIYTNLILLIIGGIMAITATLRLLIGIYGNNYVGKQPTEELHIKRTKEFNKENKNILKYSAHINYVNNISAFIYVIYLIVLRFNS